MNLTDDEVLKFQRGSPVFFEDICAVYPAKLGEIIDLGYSVFQKYLSILIVEKPTSHTDKEVQKILLELTTFQYLLMMTAIDPESNQALHEAFKFFTHEDISISLEPAQIIVGPIEEKHLLTEENFYEFQHLLKRMYFIEQEGEEIVINANDSPAVRHLKEQMKANREKVRRAKAKQAAQEGSDLKFSDLIGSLTIDNCNLNMDNIWNITYYAFHDQLKRMGWRDQFNINNQAAMAGAKLNKSQLKHWMRSIASSDKS
jgi:hypothetical protein